MVNGNVPLGAQLVDQLLHGAGGDHGVGRALDDDARGWARREEAEIVHVGRGSDRDEPANLGAAHQQLHTDQRTEAVARDPRGLRFGVDRLHPIERRGCVGQFAHTVVEAALAAAHTAKIEAQRGESARHKRLVHRLGDAIVHRAAGLWVRVQDHGDRRARARTWLEAAFETAFGAGKNDGWHTYLDLWLREGSPKMRNGGCGWSSPAMVPYKGHYR